MQNEDSTSNDLMQFPDENNLISTITGNRDSQPTKANVTAFKARVFKLIMIFAEKSQNLGPLLKSITQSEFLKQPEKLNQILQQILNRQNIDQQYLLELLQMYKTCLLYKAKTRQQVDLLSGVFVRILKKVYNPSISTVEQMVQCVILKRNCKLKINFFLFLIRKTPQIRSVILNKCSQIKKSKKVRPAQQKQLQKLMTKLKRKQDNVKKQQVN